MPPQAHELWPDDIRTIFAQMTDSARSGDTTALARACRRVESLLKRHDAAKPSRPLRLQIARSHYDLSFFYKDLGRLPAARRALERSLDRWHAATKTNPRDFYALTQLAACHNLLGLMAADANDTTAAKSHYTAALEARNQAYRRARHTLDDDDDTDICDNFTYCYGTMVNLANLHRTLGHTRDARWYYTTAIRGLKTLIPKHRKKSDREACEFFAQQWESLHGQPHYSRVAPRFLQNAQWGLAELKRQAQPCAFVPGDTKPLSHRHLHR